MRGHGFGRIVGKKTKYTKIEEMFDVITSHLEVLRKGDSSTSVKGLIIMSTEL